MDFNIYKVAHIANIHSNVSNANNFVNAWQKEASASRVVRSWHQDPFD